MIRLRPLAVGLALATALPMAPSCTTPRPLVESRRGDRWQAEPFRVARLAGRRDGAQVTFELELAAEDSRLLVIEGELQLTPQARLVAGAWMEKGRPGAGSGPLAAEHVEFLGGQGGRPGLGGRFVLDSGRGPAYRVSLPVTLLEPPSPGRSGDPAPLSPAAILDRTAEALGGREAIAGLQSLVVEADCSGPGGAFLTRIESQRPGRVYFRQEAPGDVGEIWSTPESTWTRGSDGDLRRAGDRERSFVRAHEFHLLLFELDIRFSGHRAAGRERRGDLLCDRIEMRDENGRPAVIWLRARDGLPVALEMNPDGAAGPVTIEYADWSRRDGLLYFQSFVLMEGSDREFRYRYTAIRPNAESRTSFSPPAP